jgi:hypothetical protein
MAALVFEHVFEGVDVVAQPWPDEPSGAADPLAAVEAAVARLAAEDLAALGGGVDPAGLLRLHRLVNRLSAEWLRRLAVFDAAGGWQAAGALSGAGWLRGRARLHPREAAGQLALARRLPALPATAAALATGEISVRHAQLIAAAVDEVAGPAMVAAGDAALAQAARGVDPAALRALGTHWREAVAPDRALADANRAHARRRLHVSATFDGMVAVDGLLDAEGGATLLTALHALAGPPAGGDPRTPAQRRADALVALARGALDAGRLPQAGGERPHLSVLVDLAVLRAEAGAAGATLAFAGPIAGETARRLACDAGITRIVTDGPSEILDVGRRTRTVPPALRRAVIARDRHCTAPGCDVPAEWCDVHHLVPWANGGPTTPGNLTLGCGRHHRAVHEGQWIVRRDRDGQLRWERAP